MLLERTAIPIWRPHLSRSRIAPGASPLPCRSPMPPTAKFEDWLKLDGAGLCCAPGGFHVDPVRPVERAIITHGHSDHARPGHGAVLATPQTIAIIKARLGPEAAGSFQELRYGEPIGVGGVTVRLAPAGHILGSAQVVIEHQGRRA